VGKSKIQTFSYIKDNVIKRLSNWKNQFLSQARKEILIKTIVHAIPSYSMGVFKIPTSLCKELNDLMQSFWWNHMSKNSKIHWMSWRNLGRSKAIGGLGFRDLVIFNQALLAKQGCASSKIRILVSRLLKAKYHPHSSFLDSKSGPRSSFVWRSICSAKALLKQGLVWRVGNGFSINIWKDRWLPTPITHEVQSPQRLEGQLDMVGELIDHNRGIWKEDIIRENFFQEEADVILNIPLSPCFPPNQLIWKESKDGKFSIRSADHLGLWLNDLYKGQCSKGLEEKFFWKFLWSLKVPNQVKTFTWRACHDILPTKSNLLKRKVIEEDICPCCNLEKETLFHAIWLCLAAQDVWGDSKSYFQKCNMICNSFKSLFEECISRFSKEDIELFVNIARKIWLRINVLIF
jgi:hypothetical protein